MAVCSICGKGIAFMEGKRKFKDGVICADCYRSLGVWGRVASDERLYLGSRAITHDPLSIEEVKQLGKEKIARSRRTDELRDTFNVADKRGRRIYLDKKRELVMIEISDTPPLEKDGFLVFGFSEISRTGSELMSGTNVVGSYSSLGFGGISSGSGDVKLLSRATSGSISFHVEGSPIPRKMSFEGLGWREEYSEVMGAFDYIERVIAEKRLASNRDLTSSPEEKVSDLAGQIKELKGLLDAGVLTDEEFIAAKRSLLGL